MPKYIYATLESCSGCNKKNTYEKYGSFSIAASVRPPLCNRSGCPYHKRPFLEGVS